MLKEMMAAAKRTQKEWLARITPRDNTPVEVSVNMPSPVNSLASMREMMLTLSAEAAREGQESYEEFWDFGEDEEDEFHNLPAPAQLKYDAVMEARSRDFEGEIEKLRMERRKQLKEELRKEVKEEVRKDLQKQEEEQD